MRSCNSLARLARSSRSSFSDNFVFLLIFVLGAVRVASSWVDGLLFVTSSKEVEVLLDLFLLFLFFLFYIKTRLL